jgi:hypothetical protein
VLNHPRNGIPKVCVCTVYGCRVCEFYPDERWAERRERKIGGFYPARGPSEVCVVGVRGR